MDYIYTTYDVDINYNGDWEVNSNYRTDKHYHI